MNIDITQFHAVFFEESFEGLAAMERELLSLDSVTSDPETINTIFRAAHSMKGGASTFGFTDLADFTHVMETVLNEVRNEQRAISAELVNLLLEGVDVLREVLTATQSDIAVPEERIAMVQTRLQALIESPEVMADESLATAAESSDVVAGWHIYFKPESHLLQTGNDPVRIFRELASMGAFKAELLDEKLPPFKALVAEDSYLAWELSLEGNIAKEDVLEVFEWVEDDCQLIIEPFEQSSVELKNDERNAAKVDVSSDLSESATSNSAKASVDKVSAASSLGSIRVSTDKVDSLINLVSELVITQSRLNQIGDNFTPDLLGDLRDGLAQLESNSRDMQEAIMRIRMLPISFVFNRFPRLVHDLSNQSGKKVVLEMTGEQTELDKSVIELIGDPLVHIVRNSLDHGLERPEVRLAAGKPETGLLQLHASQQGGGIVVEVHDDGAGLNENKILAKAIENGLVDSSEKLSSKEIHQLIFLPGFSTADVVSDVSGRGVGMDVVKNNISGLGGSIDVSSTPGEGTDFIIRLPLTLAIMDGQTIRVAGEHYILPLISIIETLEIKSSEIKHVSGQGELYALRNEYIPIIRLYDIFNLTPENTDLEQGLVVVVEADGNRIGLFIDDLLGQQQVVIKSLEENYRKVTGLAGATILGDGQVALILDVSGLLSLYREPTLALINDESVA